MSTRDKDALGIFEALQRFADDFPVEGIGLEVDVRVDGEAAAEAVTVSKSVGVVFANVAALTGVSVADLYGAMLTTSADAFARVLPAVASHSQKH